VSCFSFAPAFSNHPRKFLKKNFALTGHHRITRLLENEKNHWPRSTEWKAQGRCRHPSRISTRGGSSQGTCRDAATLLDSVLHRTDVEGTSSDILAQNQNNAEGLDTIDLLSQILPYTGIINSQECFAEERLLSVAHCSCWWIQRSKWLRFDEYSHQRCCVRFLRRGIRVEDRGVESADI